MRLIPCDGYCGSRLYIDQNVFKHEIANLVARTKSIITDGRRPIHERHNAYTDYTITLMNYSSGHRPVTDPMAFREDVDLDSGLVMINDKASSPLTERRVVVIPLCQGSCRL